MSATPILSKHERRGGFTLAELLVAATLLSIVMSSVYTLTHSSLRVWRDVEGGYDMHMEARNAMTLFTHEYNNIVGRAAHLFEGDSKEITMFVIAQPLDLANGEGPRLMRVIYSYNRSKRALEREEALVETALPKQPPQDHELDRSRVKISRRHTTVVANNVTRFDLEYIWAPLPEEQRPDEPPVFEPPIRNERHQERWGLPQAVKVELDLRDPEDDASGYAVKSVLPMRAPTVRRTRKQLEDIFGARR